VDKNRIGIWAHSNGGQIALSVLEVTGRRYPTVLWAPMTDPFPQSLVDTADPGTESAQAKAYVGAFLQHYDGRRYAFENYYDWIKAPILIQQGTADAQVKVEWQQVVQSRLKELGKQISLIIYQGDDHNMNNPDVKSGWEKAVEEDIGFYLKNV
jgi:dienelactone hydrolase